MLCLGDCTNSCTTKISDTSQYYFILRSSIQLSGCTYHPKKEKEKQKCLNFSIWPELVLELPCHTKYNTINKLKTKATMCSQQRVRENCRYEILHLLYWLIERWHCWPINSWCQIPNTVLFTWNHQQGGSINWSESGHQSAMETCLTGMESNWTEESPVHGKWLKSEVGRIKIIAIRDSILSSYIRQNEKDKNLFREGLVVRTCMASSQTTWFSFTHLHTLPKLFHISLTFWLKES